MGISLTVQWLRLQASSAQGTGLIPGRGIKIQHVMGVAKIRGTKILHIMDVANKK